ncbi:MAG: ornithine cyclodeaminase family protein [Thermodesulfobacteriota bacterium]
MLIINNELVAQLLTMNECIQAQEAAFKKLPSGRAIHRPRIDMYYPCRREDGYFRWGTMEGACGGYFAIRMKSDIIVWPRDKSGSWTEEKYCREPGTYCGLILLVSTDNAEPLAFINDGAIQHMRVGGGAAIGVKYLSREDSHTVGMIGSGGMARSFLEAFTCVRDIHRCKVYSPTPQNREAFAREMSRRLQIEVIPVDNARDAVKGVDILSSCTDSMKPVYDADWIEPGMHVTNVGRREMPDASVDKFDVVIRQGTAGLQMKQSERFQAERGLSPAAFIGGTVEEMKRLPPKILNRASAAMTPSIKTAARAATSRTLPPLFPAGQSAAPAPGRSPSTAMWGTRDCNFQPSAPLSIKKQKPRVSGGRYQRTGFCRISGIRAGVWDREVNLWPLTPDT